jgi:hypothetical protein
MALGGTPPRGRLTRRELTSYVRGHTRTNLYDESGVSTDRVAIYGLSDPRDIRDVRYIGQTRAPQSRFLQHVKRGKTVAPRGTALVGEVTPAETVVSLDPSALC